MTHLVDLRKKPYSLDEEAISWIEETIAQMTLDEKNRSPLCQHGEPANRRISDWSIK